MYQMRYLITFILFLCSTTLYAQKGETLIEFKTNEGSFVVRLYDETILHKERFIQNVKNREYDGLLFHRIIRNFMVQAGGDMRERTDKGMAHLESLSKATIPAEIYYPLYYHKRGALAAARISDDQNPEKKSDGIQFYIVVGKYFLEYELKGYQKKGMPSMTKEIKECYMTKGGAPHLDNEYTVFGEVVKGMDTILDIEKLPTDHNDSPLAPVYIKTARVISKK